VKVALIIKRGRKIKKAHYFSRPKWYWEENHGLFIIKNKPQNSTYLT
jgi:hypothetical protein